MRHGNAAHPCVPGLYRVNGRCERRQPRSRRYDLCATDARAGPAGRGDSATVLTRKRRPLIRKETLPVGFRCRSRLGAAFGKCSKPGTSHIRWTVSAPARRMSATATSRDRRDHDAGQLRPVTLPSLRPSTPMRAPLQSVALQKRSVGRWNSTVGHAGSRIESGSIPAITSSRRAASCTVRLIGPGVSRWLSERSHTGAARRVPAVGANTYEVIDRPPAPARFRPYRCQRRRRPDSPL